MDTLSGHNVEALASHLSNGQLFLIVAGITVGVPVISRMLQFLESRWSKADANEVALVNRLLDIIDTKFDKLADSLDALTNELRTHAPRLPGTLSRKDD